jgi:hypothetical protein
LASLSVETLIFHGVNADFWVRDWMSADFRLRIGGVCFEMPLLLWTTVCNVENAYHRFSWPSIISDRLEISAIKAGRSLLDVLQVSDSVEILR